MSCNNTMANSPINPCKIQNFISHKLRGLFTQGKGNFDHASEASGKFLRLSHLERQTTPFWQVRQKLFSSLIPRQKRNACSHQNLFRYSQILEFMLANEFVI